MDAERQDILGPDARIVSPVAGSMQFSDSLLLRAELLEDSSDFQSLRFLVNGGAAFDGDTLWANSETLARSFDLADAGIDHGLVLLGAIASDSAGNQSRAPEVLIRYMDPADPLELAPGDLTGTLGTLAVPDTLTLTIDTTDTGWVVDRIAVAMIAPTAIAIDSLELQLQNTTTGYTREAPLRIGIASYSSAGPGTTSDTTRYLPTPFSYGSEVMVNLGTLRGDSARVTIAEGDTFFVLLEPEFPDTLTGNRRFTEVGVELALLTRDGDQVQPGTGDLWLHESSSVDGSWLRLSDLIESPWYYPRVRLHVSVLTDGAPAPSTTTAGLNHE